MAKQREKKKDPELYAYRTLRNNSRARGIPFTLTIEQWRRFCRKTDYIKKKGQKSRSYTVDRKDPKKGYEEGNIRAVTNGDNVRLMMCLRYDWDEVKREMVFWHDRSLMHSHLTTPPPF